MLCKNCKKEIRDVSEFCKYCGQKLEKEAEFAFCTSCGNQIKNNSLFCKHCGASVGNVVTVPEKDNKSNKRDLAIKVIMIALLVIVGLLVFPHDEEKIGEQSDENTYIGDIVEIDKPEVGVGENKPKKPLDNNECFVCGGDGKKDCTSCDGGYITEYETGTYMGYGSATREVRKKCTVCKGSGEVKCYH